MIWIFYVIKCVLNTKAYWVAIKAVARGGKIMGLWNHVTTEEYLIIAIATCKLLEALDFFSSLF